MGIASSRQIGIEVAQEARICVQLLREIEQDVLSCLDRDSLDIYEMASKHTRALVHRHRHSLPLLTIHAVSALSLVNVGGLPSVHGSLGPEISISLADGRRHHVTLGGNARKACAEIAIYLRNGFIDFIGMYGCMPYPLLVLLSKNYATMDNCRVNVFVVPSFIQPTAEVISLVCDVWKASALEVAACAEPSWLIPVVPKLQTLIVLPTMDYLRSDSFKALTHGSSNLKRLRIMLHKTDASPWVNDYIQTFLQADRKKRFVQSLEVQASASAGNATPAPLPPLGATPSDCLATISQVFCDDARYPLADAACCLYEFENRRRREKLRVYVATATFKPIAREGLGVSPWIGTCHAYCLQVHHPNSTDE
ncbi:hypothetical protein AAVH_19504 [Aphelenchoides avenae]|nr:hypothetical protein AAVH_19504 [Aphelenchus avenae]